MSVAFEVEVARSRGVRAWLVLVAAIPVGGLMLSAHHLLTAPTWVLGSSPELRSIAIVSCIAVGLWLTARGVGDAVRGMRPGCGMGERLVVDASGEVELLGPSDGVRRPMALHGCGVFGGLTYVVLAPYPGHASARRSSSKVSLLFGRDAMPADAWRRLHVWLKWIERGRADAAPREPDRT